MNAGLMSPSRRTWSPLFLLLLADFNLPPAYKQLKRDFEENSIIREFGSWN
ncbi:hypothetical protein ACSFXN_06845 [Planococcus sp. 1R117A]|uniref:hypothetical protein n=1 Tax=Planococcus sp. 1R117A TaxID=3447020 RepID=UPI003EDC84E6